MSHYFYNQNNGGANNRNQLCSSQTAEVQPEASLRKLYQEEQIRSQSLTSKGFQPVSIPNLDQIRNKQGSTANLFSNSRQLNYANLNPTHKKGLTSTSLTNHIFEKKKQPLFDQQQKCMWESNNQHLDQKIDSQCNQKQYINNGRESQTNIIRPSYISQVGKNDLKNSNLCSDQQRKLQNNIKKQKLIDSKKGCQHSELISYKVHQNQFKSILVPIMIHQKKYNPNNQKKINDLESKRYSKFERKSQDMMKDQFNERASSKQNSRFNGGRDNLNADQYCSQGLLKIHEKNDNLNQGSISFSDLNSSDEEFMSTEGEESDPNSPLYPDKSYIDQSSDLRTALINSKALVGDYVELKNCKRCGSMIFKDQSASIKSENEEFNADISPAQLLTKMFQDEARYKFDHFIKQQELSLPQFHVAKVYSEQRAVLVNRIFQLGKKFNQRERTLHIAIEILDRFFLDRKSQSEKTIQSMSARTISIFTTTCFLIASKYDEIDDQLVFINDVQKYYEKNQDFKGIIPNYNDIVDCERFILQFFGWDLGFILPIHFVEMFLANGVLYEIEQNKNIIKTKETASKISKRCYEILGEMIKKQNCFKNQGFSGNQVASMIIYQARQDVLNLTKSKHIWPKELQLLSRQTNKQVQKLYRKYKTSTKVHLTTDTYEESAIRECNFSNNNSNAVLEPILISQRNPVGFDQGMKSPNATALKVETLMSSEKISVDIPVANIIINQQRKIPQEVLLKRNNNYMSHSKNNISEYKQNNLQSKAMFQSNHNFSVNSQILQNITNNRSIEQSSKGLSLRNKQISVERPGTITNCHVVKYTKIPTFSNQKKVSSVLDSKSRHYISSQKSEDQRLKVFSDRRLSQNPIPNLENTISVSQNIQNNQSSLGFKSVFKVTQYNQLTSQKSHKSFLNAQVRQGAQVEEKKINDIEKGQTINSQSISNANEQNVSRPSINCQKNIKINSARQDIIGSTHQSNQKMSIVPQTTKNIQISSRDIAQKMHSKYGQAYLQQIVHEAQPQSNTKSQYNTTLNKMKNNGMNQITTSSTHIASNPQNKTKASFNSALSSGYRHYTSGQASQNETLKKKYQNNYILQRNDTSKENFRKVEKTGNDGLYKPQIKQSEKLLTDSDKMNEIQEYQKKQEINQAARSSSRLLFESQNINNKVRINQ